MAENKNNLSVGQESEGGITSSYAVDDGVVLKVPYSFFGSIYDEAEEKAAKGREKWESHREFLASFTDHAPVEEAASLFSQLEVYQKKRYDADFAAICWELSHLSEAIGEAQGIRWWSIL